jgi:methionine-rich copper-binding protein CopC
MKRLIAIAALATTPAFAHIALESSTIPDGANVKAPGELRLQFSENLEPGFGGAILADATGKPVVASRPAGGPAITLQPRGLKPGLYTVSWRGMGHNRHRIKGQLRFSVVP